MSSKPLIHKQGILTQADIASVDPSVLSFDITTEYQEGTLPQQLQDCVNTLNNQPEVTISTEEPDENTPGKKGDLWYQTDE